MITRSLRMLGVVAQGNSPTAEQISEGSDALNSLIQSMQTDGIRLWSSQWETKTFTASSVVLGSDSLNYTCIRNHTSATADKPITGDNYTTYWVQKGSSGSTWAASTAYTSINQFTLDSGIIGLQNPFIRDGRNDYPVEMVEKEAYYNISDKAETGRPTHLLLEFSLSTPTVYLYPHPSSTSLVLHYNKIVRIDDWTGSSDNPNFPVRWLRTLTYGLAHELSHEYGIPITDRAYLKNEYETSFRKAKMDDRERFDMQLVKPAFRTRY